MKSISAKDYFGGYAEHNDATAERRFHAEALISVVNSLIERAFNEGCTFPENPATKSLVSGSGNGGFRPQDCKVGAKNSNHKDGRGVDIYDPRRQFASWCMANLNELESRGLHMEDTCWTPSWVHLQDVSPKSGKTVYIPNLSSPLAPMPPAWKKP